MLILSQDKNTLVNVDFTARIYTMDNDVMYMDTRGRSYLLGSYASDERAVQVVEEIADKNAMYIKCDGGMMATVNAFVQPFVHTPPKTYKMPVE